MPSFGSNMNIDYISSRLSAYCSADKWLLLFNSIVWWPSAEGLTAMVEIVGTGVVGRQGFDDFRAFGPGYIEFDYEEDANKILSIQIRGQEIDPTSLVINTNFDARSDYGFWVSVALAEKYKESLLASQAEIRRFIPPGFKHLLSIDEWDYPVAYEMLPSQTEAFPRIADVLVAKDSSIWKPVKEPNTHWAYWLEQSC